MEVPVTSVVAVSFFVVCIDVAVDVDAAVVVVVVVSASAALSVVTTVTILSSMVIVQYGLG